MVVVIIIVVDIVVCGDSVTLVSQFGVSFL